MRIVLITTYPPSEGTLNEYAYHFVKALRQKPEVDEVILLTDELPTGRIYTPEADTNVGLAPLKIIPCWQFDAWNNALRISRKVRNLNPDIVMFNIQFATFGRRKAAATFGMMTPLLLKLLGVPTIVLLHNIMETVDLKSAGFGSNWFMEAVIRLFGAVITYLLLMADRVAVTLPKYAEILAEKYNAKNVILTPHGSFEDNAQLPDRDLPAGPVRIMTFGKFGTYKKVEQLIEAFQTLQRQGHDLELIIAGTDSPNAPGYLESVKNRYPQIKNIRFTGYVPEAQVPQLFTEASIVVFPYTSTTGSSGVLHQAGSYAKAAVLPNIGDLAEVIAEEGYDGEFFIPNSVESLAAAIERMINNPERRQEVEMRNFLAAQSLPIHDVVDWYLLHFEHIRCNRHRSNALWNVPFRFIQREALSITIGIFSIFRDKDLIGFRKPVRPDVSITTF